MYLKELCRSAYCTHNTLRFMFLNELCCSAYFTHNILRFLFLNELCLIYVFECWQSIFLNELCLIYCCFRILKAISGCRKMWSEGGLSGGLKELHKLQGYRLSQMTHCLNLNSAKPRTGLDCRMQQDNFLVLLVTVDAQHIKLIQLVIFWCMKNLVA